MRMDVPPLCVVLQVSLVLRETRETVASKVLLACKARAARRVKMDPTARQVQLAPVVPRETKALLGQEDPLAISAHVVPRETRATPVLRVSLAPLVIVARRVCKETSDPWVRLENVVALERRVTLEPLVPRDAWD